MMSTTCVFVCWIIIIKNKLVVFFLILLVGNAAQKNYILHKIFIKEKY